MNWYKLLKFAQVSGEFWIDDSGNALEASGDGDFNHEAYVIDYAQSYLSEGYDYEVWKLQQFQEALQEKKEELEEKKYELEELEQDTSQIDKALNDIWDQSRDPEYYMYEIIFESLDPTEKELFDIAEMQGDPRKYAIEKWGWKRLEGHHIETWTLTPKDLEVIARGLYDAYGQMDDNALENEEFYIHVYSTNKFYSDVSWKDIDEANIRNIIRDQAFVG